MTDKKVFLWFVDRRLLFKLAILKERGKNGSKRFVDVDD